jgi:hypothetical protein
MAEYPYRQNLTYDGHTQDIWTLVFRAIEEGAEHIEVRHRSGTTMIVDMPKEVSRER